MEIVLSLKEAVMLKGTDSQMESFNKTGNLKAHPMKSLITKFEEEYARVEVVGRGKNREITLADKRSKPIKLDKRQDNKGSEYQTPIAKPVEDMIIRLLLNNKKSYKGAMSNLMFHSGLASHYISYYKSPSNIPKFNKQLSEHMIIDKSPQFISHVFSREYTTLENQIISALRRMERSGVIRWSKKRVGVINTFTPKLGKLTNKPIVNGNRVEGSYEEIYKELTDHEEQELAKVERKLQEKYDVEHFDIIYRKNLDKVKSYDSELKEKYHELGFDYHFACYFIYLKASNQKLMKEYNIRDEFLEDSYYKKAVDYSMGKANKYQSDWLENNPGFGAGSDIVHSPVEIEIINGTYMNSYGEIYHHALPEDYRYLLPLSDKKEMID